MKAILALIALVACLIRATGAELIVPQTTMGEVFTNVTFSSNITASVTFTNTQPSLFTIYHTFHLVYSPLGTNTTTATLERTLDGSFWYSVQTNTLTDGTNSFEYSSVGKWAAYRWRVTALSTNATVRADYLAE
jgi:hypothetical protein